MKEALAKELLSIIQETRGGLREGINAAMDTAPDVINEMLVYGMYRSSIMLIMCVTIVTFSIYLFFWAKKDRPGVDAHARELAVIFAAIIGCLFGFLALIGICHNALNIIKIFVAPKLYLIDELSPMIPRPRS